MLILKYTGLVSLLFILACGSGGESNTGRNDAQAEVESVQAIILKYRIEVSNIPLVGPQSEEVELAVSDLAVKYNGSVEVAVADEANKIQHSSILDFSDTSQTFLNPLDSTFSIEFYRLGGAEKSSSENDENAQHESGYTINLVPTDETRNIGPLMQCHKFNIRSARASGFAKSDSIPTIKGEIWLYEAGDVKSIILNYYKMQAQLLHDSAFEGLELWGILGRLGLPRSSISGFMEKIDGLLAGADLSVGLYSLGKKANISIKVEISDFERKRLPASYFEAPSQYKAVFGAEGTAPAAPEEKNVEAKLKEK